MKFPGATWIMPGFVCGLTLAAVVIAAVLSDQKVLKETRERMADENLRSLDRNSLLYETRLRARVNDLFVLKTLGEDDLRRQIPIAGTDSHFAQVISSLMYVRTSYNSVRLIGPEGQETLRLDWKPGGQSLATSVFPAAPSTLLNLAQRNIFQDSLKGDNQSAIFFPLEHPRPGKEQNPEDAVLRLSAKIARPDGSLDSILAFDLLARTIWSPWENTGSFSREKTYVFDSTGAWLVPPPGKSALQMLPLINQGATSISGSFIGPEDALYCYRRLNPTGTERQLVPLRMPLVDEEQIKWMLLNITTPAEIAAEAAGSRAGIWLVCGIALLVLMPCAWFGTSAIERRITALREISEARSRLDQILNTALHGICAMDAVRSEQGYLVDFRVSTINFAAEQIATHNSREVGRCLMEGTPTQVDLDNFARYRQIVETGEALSFEQYHPESARWLYIRAAKLDDGVVISFSDVTARKQAEERLREAKSELEKTNLHLQQSLVMEQELSRRASAAERAKTNFLAMMSHEIRTPMNGVLGFTEMLSQTELKSDQREYVQTIATSGDALLRIIDEILDFSRIEAGHLDIENSSFSPIELIENIRTLLGPEAQERGIELKTDLGDGIPAKVLGDSGRLRQVLVNLAGNAIKFTESGSVVIGLYRKSSPASRLRLHFFVRDTGTGIPPEKIQRIFEPFTQADSSIARRYGGAGLGLAISHRLVALMGGILQAESEPGKGSTFCFTLPFSSVESENLMPAKALSEPLDRNFAERHPLRILIAEDDPINLKLTRLMLQKLGYDPVAALNGWETLELFRNVQPDCILMDMQMPEMDGLEATRKIRAMESGRRTYIVALTANVLPEEQERCFRAGMNDYLTKPLKQDLLAAALAQIPSAP